MAFPFGAAFGLTGLGAQFGEKLGLFGPNDIQKQLLEFLQGQMGAGPPSFGDLPTFAGSQQENIMKQLLQQAQTGARQQTSEVFGRVGRSVSGRGMLAPPGKGRGALGALQIRGAAPVQQALQRQETGIRTGALGQFSDVLETEKQRRFQATQSFENRRLQMTQLLMQLEQQIPGIMDYFSGLFGGAAKAAPLFV